MTLRSRTVGFILRVVFAISLCLSLSGQAHAQFTPTSCTATLTSGASGARITTTLLSRMRDEGVQYGVASLCIGQGQGAATVFENCN